MIIPNNPKEAINNPLVNFSKNDYIFSGKNTKQNVEGGQLERLWFIGQHFPDKLMKPAKRKSTMTQILVCNEETPPPPPPSPPPQAKCRERFCCKINVAR